MFAHVSQTIPCCDEITHNNSSNLTRLNEYYLFTDLGSEILYERRFAEKSEESHKSSARASCVKTSAEVSMSGGFMRSYAEGSGSYDESECKTSSEDEDFQKKESAESIRTISRGSKPKSLDEWIDSEFTPVVIQAELDEITNLFKNSILTNETGYGFEKSLDGDKIRSYFLTMMQLYCSLNLPNATSIKSADDVDNDCTGRLHFVNI